MGVGTDEAFLGSDVTAFVDYTREAIELGQDQTVRIEGGDITITDFDGSPVDDHHFTVDWDASAAEKGGWPASWTRRSTRTPPP